jgi:DNA (cytosine-5)-methyltransferase 1
MISLSRWARRSSDLYLADGFCGAGGSSEGCRWAGVQVRLAMNHNEQSLKTHAYNFPDARHECLDITSVPFEKINSYVEDLAFGWWSAQCRDHSQSSGIKLLNQMQQRLPIEWDDEEDLAYTERSRATMNEGIRWAQAMMEQGKPFYGLIFENVPQVNHWKGMKQWRADLDKLGYHVQEICFNSRFAQAAFSPEIAEQIYPVASNRDRWYAICTLKGNPLPDVAIRPRAFCHSCAEEMEAIQTWKECARANKWGDYKRQYIYTCPRCHEEIIPYYTPASAMIDWSLPMTRIRDYKEPLAETTINRITKGLYKFCSLDGGEDPSPFLLDVSHTQSENAYVRSIRDVCFTQTTAQTTSLVVPPGAKEQPFVFHTLRTPEAVKKAIKRHIRQSHLKGMQAEQYQQEQDVLYRQECQQRYPQERAIYLRSYRETPRIPDAARHAFVASYYNGSDVLSFHDDVVSTCTTIDRHGLVIPPASWQKRAKEIPPIEDCLYRTLKSKENKRAMGIPESYTIVATSQREETRQCGLAVTPAMATLLMHRVLASLGEKMILQVSA